jgi:hypothetical protein
MQKIVTSFFPWNDHSYSTNRLLSSVRNTLAVYNFLHGAVKQVLEGDPLATTINNERNMYRRQDLVAVYFRMPETVVAALLPCPFHYLIDHKELLCRCRNIHRNHFD